MIGDALIAMGDAPRRVMAALEGSVATAAVVAAEVSDELIASRAVEELTADLELGRLLPAAAADAVEVAPPAMPARGGRPPPKAEPGHGREAAAARPIGDAAAAPAPATDADVGERRGRARERARSWLAATAERAGASSAVDRPVAVEARGRSAVGPTLGTDAASPVAPSSPPPVTVPCPPTPPPTDLASAMLRLTSALDRLAGVAPAAAGRRARPSGTVSTGAADRRRAIVGGLAHLDDPRSVPDGQASPRPVDVSRGPSWSPPPDPAPARVALSSPPAGPRAAPGEPALADAPATGLRRFATMAEAAAPSAPGQVDGTAALGPRGPSASIQPAPLDDLELAERITRVLRREARRDGIDLEPLP